MIKHIVCFKLSDFKYAEEAKKILLSMQGNVPMLKSIEVGIDKLRSDRSFDVILQVVVENMDELDKYQHDEYHCSVVKKFMHSVAIKSVAIDYDI